MEPCKLQVKKDKLLPSATQQPTFASIFNSNFNTGNTSSLDTGDTSSFDTGDTSSFDTANTSSFETGNTSSSDTGESEDSTLGAYTNQTTSTPCHEATGECLPVTELRLKVMALALKFQNGIHSDRWEHLYNIRVKKLLMVPGLKDLVNTALFTYNKLVVKPERTHCIRDIGWRYKLRYPPHKVAQHVRDLEFHIGTRPSFEDSKFSLSLGIYMAWLQKLSRKEMGFENLNTVTISFKLQSDEYPHHMGDFLAALEALPSGITTPCKQLIIDAPDHGAWQRLSARLTAIDPN